MLLSRIKNESGMSLVDVIMGLVIIGVGFFTMLQIQGQLQNRSLKTEILMKGTTLARSYMEIVRSKRFDEQRQPPYSTTLTAEESDESDYDDVDDYNGFTKTDLSGYPGFSVSVRVFYVDPSVSWDDKVNDPTRYKRIVTTVYNSEIDSLFLSCLISSRYKEQ